MNAEVVVKAVVKEKAPLDELMLAMDVVDTLRHKELVLARELTAEDRDAKLLEQLREIYTSQGIEVTDEILQRGVDALREERFVYTPPAPSFSRTLAHAYVARGRWGKPIGFAVAALAVAAVAFQLFVRGPELRQATEVPAELTAAFAMLDANTDDPAALDPARAQLATGQAAVAQGDFDAARAATAEIEALNAGVLTEYEVRIVSRPGETSGFWREPQINARARNYYLVVEAIDRRGEALRLPIVNEEDQKTHDVRAWGLRVDQATYERAVADKQDDGIIQNNVVGHKRRGVLDREYTVPTTGAAVTEW
ncbi:MAG TPA: DUF6384 family protein [Gammaproteobacteria bacterium]|nr:DUF6384 family protein [Gammaproteobacteria bacterium]